MEPVSSMASNTVPLGNYHNIHEHGILGSTLPKLKAGFRLDNPN